MRVIRIPGWDRLQHYKTRNAPWCKSYRHTLDQPGYRALSFAARGLLADLWRLAIETSNAIPYVPEWLAYRLSADPKDIIVLAELLAKSLAIEIAEVASMDASVALHLTSQTEREKKLLTLGNGDGEKARGRPQRISDFLPPAPAGRGAPGGDR